jgi:MFS family permease
MLHGLFRYNKYTNLCSALTYVSAFTTNSEAALYNALTGLSWGIGAILGPVIGGAFSDSSATWRWVS